ncbi:hypothetical protein M1B72_17425 [Geomonas paludis]|uniref:Uncharacterized protein n=1 Tax=Geomonas paludis TaxID=2740185 RepID=A0A6V8MZ60_9BACT|nr:hypothetical protein [Geomonas paludis]UPU35211.1 hypothetical protein M1B72_17425 [Geomonas paludis]GFO64937.1 hypothetical protein GMPD_28560 [Geomonas paludis]
MGVLVCYDDFTYDVINDYFLDHLVSTGCIVGFDRSEHWVKKEDTTQPSPSLSHRLPA